MKPKNIEPDIPLVIGFKVIQEPKPITMKTNPKPLKILLISTLSILVAACANPLSTTRMLSVEEQCLILNEKRNKSTVTKSRHKNISPRTVNMESFPDVRLKIQNQWEQMQLQPFAVESLYASISTSPITPEERVSKTVAIPSNAEWQHKHGVVIHELHQDKVPEKTFAEVSSASLTTLHQDNSRKTFLENNSVAIMVGASGLLSLLMLSLAQSRSKKISYWAAENPWKARSLIAGTHTLTGLSALYLGHHLYGQEIFISEAVNYAALSVFTTSCLLYPMKNSFSFTHSYFSQKANDISLFTSGVVMMLSAGNHYHFTQQPVSVSEVVFSLSTTNTPEKNVYLVKSKKDLNAEKLKFKQEAKKELSKGAKVALTILLAITFAAAVFGLAALSCSIACSGNEGLAAVVGIGGGIGLVALFILGIRGILGIKRKSKQATEA